MKPHFQSPGSLGLQLNMRLSNASSRNPTPMKRNESISVDNLVNSANVSPVVHGGDELTNASFNSGIFSPIVGKRRSQHSGLIQPSSNLASGISGNGHADDVNGNDGLGLFHPGSAPVQPRKVIRGRKAASPVSRNGRVMTNPFAQPIPCGRSFIGKVVATNPFCMTMNPLGQSYMARVTTKPLAQPMNTFGKSCIQSTPIIAAVGLPQASAQDMDFDMENCDHDVSFQTVNSDGAGFGYAAGKASILSSNSHIV
jgi:hypothetical protein